MFGYPKLWRSARTAAREIDVVGQAVRALDSVDSGGSCYVDVKLTPPHDQPRDDSNSNVVRERDQYLLESTDLSLADDGVERGPTQTLRSDQCQHPEDSDSVRQEMDQLRIRANDLQGQILRVNTEIDSVVASNANITRQRDKLRLRIKDVLDLAQRTDAIVGIALN